MSEHQPPIVVLQPKLDATVVARAFEVMLPAHKAGLHLTHNEHRNYYDTAAKAVEEAILSGHPLMFVSEVEKQKAIATDELWILQWYPETPIGFHQVAAATLPAIAQWLQDNGLAFGS